MNYKQMYSKIKRSLPVENAMVNSLYTLSTRSQYTALAFVLLVVIFLYPILSFSIVIWGAVLFTLTLYRIYSNHIFTTDNKRYSVETWYKIFTITSLLTAAILSLLGSVYIHHVDEYNQLFIVTILVAATSVSTSSLSADFRIAIAYIGIILVSLIMSLLSFQTVSSFALALLISLLFMSQLLMIFNNHIQRKENKDLYEELKLREEENKLLLDENRLFIADMVHQIKTPLTVIMTNAEIVEMESGLEDSPNIRRINSAINTLSNSFEDLSYVIANEAIEYKPVSLDFREFLNDRIDFFKVIAEAREQNITTEMTHHYAWVDINDIELERLIDNNLSNAIKHSFAKTEIRVVLEKRHTTIILKFISKGNAIKDASKIFEKNYTESHRAKRSLGLGLNMVKHICQKNNIAYSAYSAGNINTFTYIFKP